jgi:hypothetical protein
MKQLRHNFSIRLPRLTRCVLASHLWLLALLALALPGLVNGQSSFPGTTNVLENSDWIPTSVLGLDAGRDWTFTVAPDNINESDEAYASGSDLEPTPGSATINVPGNTTPEFLYTASDWYTASPGQTWGGGAYFNNGNNALNGSQEGLAVLVFADASYNVLDATTNVVFTPGSPAGFGGVTNEAPADTAYVQVQFGLLDPGGNSAGSIILTEADLISTNISPVWVDRFAGGSAIGVTPVTIPITVTIAQGLNASNAVSVTLSNGSPNILTLAGESGSVVTLDFAEGATNVQTITATKVSNGTDTFYVSGANLSGNSISVSDQIITNTLAQTLFAQYAPGFITNIISDNGSGASWSNLVSTKYYQDTTRVHTGNNNPLGNLGIDTQYAWDTNYLYILFAEDTNYVTADVENDYETESAYFGGFYAYDYIALWIDLSDTCGDSFNGFVVAKPNADYQPWFGFSSYNQSLYFARANDSAANPDTNSLVGATILTDGDFSDHNRTIEVAILWSNIASDVLPTVPPSTDIAVNPAAGRVFGSQPLLGYDGYQAQSFASGTTSLVPSGVDSNSVNVELITGDTAFINFQSAIQSDHLVITWPAGVFAQLQSSPVLGGPLASWSNVAATPALVGFNHVVTLPKPAAKAYYRLVAAPKVINPVSQGYSQFGQVYGQ